LAAVERLAHAAQTVRTASRSGSNGAISAVAPAASYDMSESASSWLGRQVTCVTSWPPW